MVGDLQWTVPVEVHDSIRHKTIQTKDVVHHQARVTALQMTIPRTILDPPGEA
jgi:hypothetical protein